MKRLAALPALAAVLLAISLAGASTASATVLCNSATNPCTTGTFGKETLEAQLKAGTKATLGSVSCEESTLKTEVTNPGGEGKSVSGNIPSLTFGKCTNSCTVSALNNGTFTIGYPGSNSGVLSLGGLELKTVCTILGKKIECVYGGSASSSLKGGNPATIPVAEQALAKKEGTEGCSSSASWSGEYTINRSLFVEESGVSGVLCKTATNPCSSVYPLGTKLQTFSTSPVLFKFGFIEILCKEVVFKGEVTELGASNRTVAGKTTQLTFFECTSALTTLKNGTFVITYTSGNSGTLTLEKFEVKFGTSCLLTGPASLGLTGGAPASAVASSSIGANFSCGPSSWSGEFKVSEPSPLYVSAT